MEFGYPLAGWNQGTQWVGYPQLNPGYVYANYGVNPASWYSAAYPYFGITSNGGGGSLRKALDWPPGPGVLPVATVFPPALGLPYSMWH